MNEQNISNRSTDGLCGCGRPMRYITRSGDACNKYRRCMTYEEQSDLLAKLEKLLNAYRTKREVDGLNGRKWDASKHFQAEADIETLEKCINRPMILSTID